MGVLLLLAIFTIVLTVGFGFNGWTLGLLILGLTVGLSFLMVGIDIEEIKKNWKEKRCDLDILLTSFLYKPSSDTRETGDFVRDNFDFCIKQGIQDVLKIILTPLIAALGKEMEVTTVLMETMNQLRTLKALMWNSFMSFINPFYQRFIRVGMALSQNFQRYYSAMRRVGGIAVSTLYLGLSLQVSIENFVKFVIKVVLIIMGIIAAMFVVLFFGLIPFLFILITTVAVLDAGGVDTGGFGSVFCFEPSTKIRMKDGTEKAIERVAVGEELEDGSKVEGVLRSTADTEQMYSLQGIVVSGSHLVWDEDDEDWIQVSESPFARQVLAKPEFLVCLRTSTRTIPLRDSFGSVWMFRDWEELPLDVDGADSFWNYLVQKILKSKSSGPTPQEDPLCGPRCLITLKTGEKIPISMCRIGDTIYSEEGFTKILGIYEGEACLTGPTSLSDGIWIQNFKDWVHLTVPKGTTQRGFHLVTQSGTFWVESENHSGFIRDFTEVGLSNLPLTYSFTRALLKKSLAKEELCEPVSSSQAFLSYLQPIF
jgi:hypothetical protein